MWFLAYEMDLYWNISVQYAASSLKPTSSLPNVCCRFFLQDKSDHNFLRYFKSNWQFQSRDWTRALNIQAVHLPVEHSAQSPRINGSRPAHIDMNKLGGNVYPPPLGQAVCNPNAKHIQPKMEKYCRLVKRLLVIKELNEIQRHLTITTKTSNILQLAISVVPNFKQSIVSHTAPERP